MLQFLQLPAAEQKLYIEQAAQRRSLSPVIVEKDFWVCWMLGELFQSPFREHLVFKGGTSLSKVHAVIERFSEDIDLSLSPQFLQIPEPDFLGLSRNQANKWMTQAEEACANSVQQAIVPVLEGRVVSALGAAAPTWLKFERDPLTKSPVIYFHYPTSQPTGFDYLRRAVKLEFGSLTDQRPNGLHPVRPWLAESLPQAFADWDCHVVALEVERTFWEKATILHAEFHRPAEKPTPERFSRHYADTAALAQRHDIATILHRHELRQRVVDWKRCFFGSGWASYETAVPGSFKLMPPDFRRAELLRDYQAMRDMYLGEPLKFEQIEAALQDLEKRINTV